MGLPIALQLYTIREVMAKDFDGALAQVAKIGYRHVEFAGFYDRTPAQVRKLLDQLGLKAVSAHIGVDGSEENIKNNAEAAKTIGYKVLVSGLPKGEMRQSAAGYRQGAKILAEASKKFKSLGLTYAYHNHSFEFDKFADAGNVTGMDILYNEASPPLSAELDVYWVQHGYADPVTWIKKLAGRVPLLHIKDMEKGEKRGFAEVGTGILDMKAVIAAAPAAGVQYLIVEQDSAWKDGNALESARISFENLKRLAG